MAEAIPAAVKSRPTNVAINTNLQTVDIGVSPETNNPEFTSGIRMWKRRIQYQSMVSSEKSW
jgi:hypothetical protein